MPNLFQKNIEARKEKEKDLKNLHDSIMKKSYINGYQNNHTGPKELGLMNLFTMKDGTDKGEDLLDKIGETLNSAQQAEKEVNIPEALKGVQNGLKDLENLQDLNQEQGKDIQSLLAGIKDKYETVNELINNTRTSSAEIQRQKKKLNEMVAKSERKEKEYKINKMENRLKNTKRGLYLYYI